MRHTRSNLASVTSGEEIFLEWRRPKEFMGKIDFYIIDYKKFKGKTVRRKIDSASVNCTDSCTVCRMINHKR